MKRTPLFHSITIVALYLLLAVASPAQVRAEGLAVGPHIGFNLDEGSLHLGGDVMVSLTRVAPGLELLIWPSFAHVIVHDGHDVELLGVDFPFVFTIDDAPVRPFLAPGMGLAFYGDTSVKVNLIGGTFFELDGDIHPFTAVAIRLVDGTFVDLLGGVMFELE